MDSGVGRLCRWHSEYQLNYDAPGKFQPWSIDKKMFELLVEVGYSEKRVRYEGRGLPTRSPYYAYRAAVPDKTSPWYS